MPRRYIYFALFLAVLCSIPSARAQSSFDLNIGGGSAWVGSNGQGIEGPQSINAFASCSPSAPTDSYCQATPSLKGFFLGLGMDAMLTKKYGLGFEASFQPNRPDYGPLQYRQTFIDVNGIYSPISQKRVEVKIEGGIGAARTSFAINETGCVGIAVCSSETQPIGNASHFAVNFGVGLQLFVTEHIFVRPEFKYHYVTNFTQQFGSNNVPSVMAWVGYSFGEH